MDGMERARELIAEELEKKTGFLDLGNLDLTELPAELFELTHLLSLNLGPYYPDEKNEFRQSANTLGINSISVLPDSLRRFESLIRLGLDQNPITRLEPIGSLKSLQSLDCSQTQVSDLQPLATLPALQSLDCSHTQVSDLQPLATLPALQSLNCSGTQVSDLQPLATLPALQSLYCSQTQVSDLQPLATLPALQSLNCSGTQVTVLEPLTRLPKISTIRANSCRLADLPTGFVFKTHLQYLYLHDTGIPGIPSEILSENEHTSCLERLRDHLRDLAAGIEEVLESKLITLGNGRVGKTQICRRLRGLPFDASVPSTHGITVTSEPWASSTEGELLNIWDFGGQDIYHGAHTLFMKTRAIFLVVWHSDFETASEQEHEGLVFRNYPLSYWLEYVRTLGRAESPVIAVQSQCDRPEQEVKRLPVEDRFLKFPSLKPCWYSAQENRGRAALDEAIQDGIRYLRERDGVSTIGAGRMRVLRKLEEWRDADQKLDRAKREHRTLTQAEFRGLCEEAGGVSSPDSLLEYLHNAGVVFYRHQLFHDRIILDQSWALDAVYAIFERSKSYRQIAGQGGRFTRSLLEMMVWREYSEAEQRLFLSLMESCGICFVHRPVNEKLGIEAEYIAPDLLPDKKAAADQLAGRWNEQEKERRLEYEYEFLHPGLTRCLICDTGARAGESGVYWKFGVWVYEKESGCRAIIEQQMTDDRRGRITARVQGQRHEKLAQWIRERIEERSRLFGYPEIQPVVDEFPGDGRFPGALPEEERKHARGKRKVHRERVVPGDDIRDEDGELTPAPVFQHPPPSIFPKKSRQIFVSYAWGDQTPDGKSRMKVVDDLCTVMTKQGVEVLRDCEHMKIGDRISEFMTRLAEGDFIIAIISDKYLRSPYCMYELFRIYRNCGDDPNRFLGRVIPLILPDARLKDLSDRIAYAGYWKKEKEKLVEGINQHGLEVVGKEAFGKFKMISDFAHNVSDILEHLTDKLMPRDLTRMANEGYREILELIGDGSEASQDP